MEVKQILAAFALTFFIVTGGFFIVLLAADAENRRIAKKGR